MALNLNLLDPSVGIQTIMDPPVAGHMPGARPMASSVLREAGLEDLYSPSTAERLLEQSLCPSVGDGDMLRPETFAANLNGALDALADCRAPEIRQFVRGELRPLIENTELLKAYAGLMISG